MKFLLICLALSSLSTTSFAACKDCVTLDKLSHSLASLKASNDDDLVKGQTAVISGVPLFANLKKAKKDAPALLQSLLEFTLNAGPFDSEAQASQSLAEVIKSNPKLKVPLQAFIASKKAKAGSSSCKVDLFERNVAIQQCYLNTGADGQDIKNKAQADKLQKCPKPFNYENCLKEKS